MERIYLTKNDFQSMDLISNTTSLVCKKDGTIYKIFNPNKTDLINAEQKLENSDNKKLYRIERPSKLIYLNNKFIGYTSKELTGIDLYTYLNNNSSYEESYNLDLLAFIFKDIEDIVSNANKEGIILPDLGTLSNIFVTKKGLIYIDYGGLQIDNNRTEDYSSLLTAKGWYQLFKFPKYYNKDYLFTSELDKKTLIYLFFKTAFKIDLKKYAIEIPRVIKELFEKCQINDFELYHKVWLLSQNNLSNEFITNDIARLAKDYKIVSDIKHSKRVLVRK